MPPWNNSFAYASARPGAPDRSVHEGPGLQNARSDAWLQKSMKNLARNPSGYSNHMGEADREKLLGRMATAGREYNRGHITENAYGRYVTTLLKGDKKRELRDKHNARPSTAPGSSLGRRVHAEGAMLNPQLRESLPRRNHLGVDTSYEQKVRARSARQRTRALAWMEKVSKDDQDYDDEVDDALPLREGGEDRSAREVIISRAPRSTTSAALKEALEGQFGRLNRVDPNGRGQFLVRFKNAADSRRCATAGKCALRTRVLARIIQGETLASVKKVCSKFGRVISCQDVGGSAVITFDNASAAARAVGAHRLTSQTELDVWGIPPGITQDQVASALGGKRDVVRCTLDPADRTRATAVMVSATRAERLVGSNKHEVPTVSRGGSASALERAQSACRKGSSAPWASCLLSKPMADVDLHTYGFNRGPANPREFKKRAAGTYNAAVGKRLPGKARAYTTTKHKLSCKLRQTVLSIDVHDVELAVQTHE